MTNLINQTLLQIQADLTPVIEIRQPSISMYSDSFRVDEYSILKWAPAHYSGQFEVYHESWNGPFWAPTLLEIFQHIASLDPAVFYSPSIHPELFL